MRTVKFVLLAVLMLAPATAHAQFAGIGKKLLGGGGSTEAPDADTFLTNATRSTKNVMISAALLAQAVTNRNDLAARNAEINALMNAPSIKELDAHTPAFNSDLAVLNQRADLAGDLSAAYRAGNAQQKQLIATALGNLAIGIYRNTELVGQAGNVVQSVGRNPALISRASQFKTAAALVGLQAKGLGGIATSLPKLFSALKVKAPDTSKVSEPAPIAL